MMEMLTEDEAQLILDLKVTHSNEYRVDDKELGMLLQLESKGAVYLKSTISIGIGFWWALIVLNFKHPEVKLIVDVMEML